MKIAGVIAEYNPFHNGHKYQLEQIRKQTGADHIIVAMSGNFVQRGIPALLDKYSRAEMALSEGADLVIELPFLYSTASAELFAYGGVSLLANCGIIDQLCFGAESTDLPRLQNISETIAEEPDDYRAFLKSEQAKGLPFPAAREKALCALMNDADTVLHGSNNILAIEYLKQLYLMKKNGRSRMIPYLIQRVGDNYNNPEIETVFASATAIREYLRQPKHSGPFGLIDVVPDSSLMPLLDAKKDKRLVYECVLTAPLSYALTLARYQTPGNYGDCSPELLQRILKLSPGMVNYSDFCMQVKNKSITYSHVCHALLNILFQVTEEELSLVRTTPVPYLHILGFKKSSACLLSQLRNQASVPLITSLADSFDRLAPEARLILQKDLMTSDFYNQLVLQQSGIAIKNDYSHPMVMI